jgi:hypothetical protein
MLGGLEIFMMADNTEKRGYPKFVLFSVNSLCYSIMEERSYWFFSEISQ